MVTIQLLGETVLIIFVGVAELLVSIWSKVIAAVKEAAVSVVDTLKSFMSSRLTCILVIVVPPLGAGDTATNWASEDDHFAFSVTPSAA